MKLSALWMFQNVNESFISGNEGQKVYFCWGCREIWDRPLLGVKWLMDKYVPHCFHVSVSIVGSVTSGIATSDRRPGVTSGPKTNPGVGGITIFFVIANDSDPCHRPEWRARLLNVETLHVTVDLEWRIGEQGLPGVAAEVGYVTIRSVSDQRVKRWRCRVDHYEIRHRPDLHSQADLGKRRGPVGGEFGFFLVQSCQPVWLVVRFFVGPQGGWEVKG